MIKNSIIASFLFLFSLSISAQDGGSAYYFLKLPYSARAAALGGENVSVVEDDITMAIHNPALLSYVSDKTLNLNYMSYIDGVKVGSAAFSRLLGIRSSWAVAAQYVDYGEMKEMSEENMELGTFSAKDIAISGIYTYDLSERWSGGVKANFIFSNYEKYSSFAIGVDLGVNYYHEESEFSASLVVRNLGGQITSFEDEHESLPRDIQVGISKKFAHAPFRLSATMHNLTEWDSPIDNDLLNHVVFGADFLPTNTLFLSVGYNIRRGKEMKIVNSSHWAGITGGAGIHIKRFKLSAAYAKYHTTSSSLLFNLAITL